MTTSTNHTLIPIFLSWKKQPLEKRYALAFVTRDNFHEDIAHLAGERGVQDLSGILMDITFCTNCEREHDPSLDDCDSPIEGVKRASLNSYGFSENFMEYLDEVFDGSVLWTSMDGIQEQLVDAEENEELGQTILLLWDNMTFAIAYYFPDRLDSLFETLDEYGDPSGQHFKPLHAPFLIDLQKPCIYDDEIEDFREPTDDEEISEVGFSFLDPKMPDVIFEILKDDSNWSEFSFAAQEAWYDSIRIDAAKMSYNKFLPHLEKFLDEMRSEAFSTLDMDIGDLEIECHDGFLNSPIDSVHENVKLTKELEAGCHMSAVTNSFDLGTSDDENRMIEVGFYFYIGSVVKARISVGAYAWKAAGDDGIQELDDKKSKILYDDVVEFRTISPLKTDPSTGQPDITDILVSKPFDPSILDPLRASFKKACVIAAK